MAHVFNVEFFIDSHKSNDTLIERLNNMDDIGDEAYLNPIRNRNAVSRIHFVCFSFLKRTKSKVLDIFFVLLLSVDLGENRVLGERLLCN